MAVRKKYDRNVLGRGLDNISGNRGLGLDALIDQNARDKDLLTLIRYLAEEDKENKVFENQTILKMPIVRNGRAATAGYAPEIWKTWE